MRNIIYCRVSTSEQTVENQIREIREAGYFVDENCIFADEVSGSSKFADRPGARKLLSNAMAGDTLIVNKLDRLGRNPLDIQLTLEALQQLGISVIVLQLGRTDLNSAIGGIIVAILAGVARLELEFNHERTLAGLSRARAEGRIGGRPRVIDSEKGSDIKKLLEQGLSIRKIAKVVGCSKTTVHHIKKMYTA